MTRIIIYIIIQTVVLCVAFGFMAANEYHSNLGNKDNQLATVYSRIGWSILYTFILDVVALVFWLLFHNCITI